MKGTIGAILVLTFSLLPASLEGGEGSWDNLKRLRPGQKIVVADMDWKLTQGKLVAVSEEAISLGEGQKVVEFSRADVLQVGKQKSRWRKIGIAAAIAAVASGGFFLPFAVAAAEPAAFAATGIISAGTAGLGGVFGASLPPGYRPIYQARVRPQKAESNSPTEQTADTAAQSSAETAAGTGVDEP